MRASGARHQHRGRQLQAIAASEAQLAALLPQLVLRRSFSANSALFGEKLPQPKTHSPANLARPDRGRRASFTGAPRADCRGAGREPEK